MNLHPSAKFLITRTDRIGDVLLSLPVIDVLREKYPSAHISFLCSPETELLLRNKKEIDQVIVLDKTNKHRTIRQMIVFSREIHQQKFDATIILHPTNRVHWLTFMARIPIRIGYRKKWGRLLTHAITDRKWQGEKHEWLYNFDLLNFLDLSPPQKMKTYPIPQAVEENISYLLIQLGLREKQFICLHPLASCPSKIWPQERFWQVMEELKKMNLSIGVCVIVIGGPHVPHINIHQGVINLVGKLNVIETMGLLKNALFLLTNDSGPAHMASAVGTPVIALFGRAQPGLSPKRWSPLGEANIILHKDVGCKPCLAHRCAISFECLQAISVTEVVETAQLMIRNLNSL